MSAKDWHGPLPASWDSVALRQVSRIYAGGTPDREVPEFWADGTIPWLNSGCVNQWAVTEPSEYITEEGFRRSSTRWVPAQSVLLGLAGQGKTKGTPARLEFTATCNQSVAAIVPNYRLEYRFLHYWLSVNHSNLRGMAGGDKRDGLNLQHVGSIRTPLPPVPDQTGIADFLDRETAKIDAVIEKQRALLDGLRRRRVRTVLSAVTTGVRPDRPTVPSGVHWSAEVPSDWNVMPLKRIFSSVQPGVWGEEPDGGEDDILCVRVADFDRPQLRVGDSVETIRKVPVGDRRAKMLQRGDLLIEKSGGTGINPVGFVAIYDREEEAVCANFIARMRVNGDQNSRFWMYALHASYASGLTWNYVKQTTGIQNLDLNALMSERFPAPPLEEQREIAAHMDRETARIDALIARSERLIELSQERRAALITAAVTGQIDITTDTDIREEAA